MNRMNDFNNVCLLDIPIGTRRLLEEIRGGICSLNAGVSRFFDGSNDSPDAKMEELPAPKQTNKRAKQKASDSKTSKKAKYATESASSSAPMESVASACSTSGSSHSERYNYLGPRLITAYLS